MPRLYPLFILVFLIATSTGLSAQGGVLCTAQYVVQSVVQQARNLFFGAPPPGCPPWEKIEVVKEALQNLSSEERKKHIQVYRGWYSKHKESLRNLICARNLEYVETLLNLHPEDFSRWHLDPALKVAVCIDRFDLYEALNECWLLNSEERLKKYAASERYRQRLEKEGRDKHYESLCAEWSWDAFAAQRLECLIQASSLGCLEIVSAEIAWRRLKKINLNKLSQKSVSSYSSAIKSGCKEYHAVPLHAAVDNNKKNVALLLLLKGANYTQLDHDGDTAMTIATRRSLTDPSYQSISNLLNLFIKYRPLMTRLSRRPDGHPWTRKLLEACPALASIYIKDANGNNPLHAAVNAGDWELAKLLLEVEPRLFVEKNNVGQIPLMIAAGKSDRVLGIQLLDYAYSQSTLDAPPLD